MKMLVAMVFLVLTGCSLVMARPEVAVRDVILTSFDDDGVTIDCLLAVTNPNSFHLTLRGYTYDLRVMSKPLTKGGSRHTIDFAGGATTEVRLPVRIDFQDLLEILRCRPDPEGIPYQLVAGLEVETPIGVLSVPVEKNGTLALPERYRPTHFLKKIGDIFKGTKYRP